MTTPIRLDRTMVNVLEQAERSLGKGPSDASGPSFADVFKRTLSDTSEMQTNAESLIGAFLRGEPVELHQVMAASEEASISLELLVEIRNKLTDAYRTIMNVQ